MTRAQILLEKRQHKLLAKIAKLQNKSMSEIVRDWIEEKSVQSMSDRKKDPLFELDGIGHDSASDVSLRHDEYLYGKNAKQRWEK